MVERRISFWQDLGWRIEAVAFAAYVGLIRLLPIDAASAFGAWLLGSIGPLTEPHRTARRNLEIAFPEIGEKERDALLAAQWRQTGRTFAELFLLDRITADPARVEVVGIERLRAIAAGGQPVVFVSGHLANWEVMPAVIVQSGVACQVTYRAANNPYVDHQIKESRRRYGVRLFAPKGGDGSREMLQSLAKGESVALMNDQKFNGGVAAPFFGVTCHTAPGPTRLARRSGGLLQPMSVRRLKGARFRVEVHEPIAVPRTADKTADIHAGVEAVNAFVEARVREAPPDWFWTHKRWPNPLYEPGSPIERVQPPR